MSWFTIKNMGENKAQIDIDGVIGWEVTSSDFRRQIRAMGNVTDIDVNVNTIGGATGEGIAIKNVLLDHPASVHVHVDGYALSSGSIISMGGDVVTMAADAGFMIHEPWNIVAGNAGEMRKEADVLDTHTEMIVQSYLSRSLNISEEKLREDIANETWYTAQEALDAGFIDEIKGQATDESQDVFDSDAVAAFAKEHEGAFKYKNAPANVSQRLNAIRSKPNNSGSAAESTGDDMSKFTQAELDAAVKAATDSATEAAQANANAEAVNKEVKAVHERYKALMGHKNASNTEAVALVAGSDMELEQAMKYMDQVATKKPDDENKNELSQEEIEKIGSAAAAKAIAKARAEASDTKDVDAGINSPDTDDVADIEAARAQAANKRRGAQ